MQNTTQTTARTERQWESLYYQMRSRFERDGGRQYRIQATNGNCEWGRMTPFRTMSLEERNAFFADKLAWAKAQEDEALVARLADWQIVTEYFAPKIADGELYFTEWQDGFAGERQSCRAIRGARWIANLLVSQESSYLVFADGRPNHYLHGDLPVKEAAAAALEALGL